MFRSSILLAVLGCLTVTTGYSATIIHAGRLIDGATVELRTEVSLVIDDGRITRIVEGYIEAVDGDKLISLRAHTVMPGLMDMHTHLMSQHSKESYTERFFMDQAEYALRSTVYARRTLMARFTTVRDLGDNGVNAIALRKAIGEGWVVGPRIFTSGKSLATTGGHADPTNALRGDYRRDPGPVEGVINGTDDARKAVRQRYKDGADLIKLTTDSGVSAHGDNAREFELMVEGGMPPMKAIQSATREAARLLKIDDRLGTLEEKKLADVVAVEGNPLEDIRAMRRVVFVMKEGVVFKDP